MDNNEGYWVLLSSNLRPALCQKLNKNFAPVRIFPRKHFGLVSAHWLLLQLFSCISHNPAHSRIRCNYKYTRALVLNFWSSVCFKSQLVDVPPNIAHVMDSELWSPESLKKSKLKNQGTMAWASGKTTVLFQSKLEEKILLHSGYYSLWQMMRLLCKCGVNAQSHGCVQDAF